MVSEKHSARVAPARAPRISTLFQRGLEDQETQFLWLSIADIIVHAQIRQQFEDDDNRLQELAASIRAHGVMQPILVRPGEFGRYILVAGERRLRAAKLAGLLAIPAIVREISDTEADDMQLAENIQRKNLTQIEEAQKIQRDLDQLGSVEAVLAKHQKSKSWLSKMLGLLNLSQQARRLLSENISADTEVIAQINTIEKLDPALARATVDELKQTRGKQDARAKVLAVKNTLKPRKSAGLPPASGAVAASGVAGMRSKLQQLPGPVRPGRDHDLLSQLYHRIHDLGNTAPAVLAQLAPHERAQLEACLQAYYLQGQGAAPVQVLQQLHTGAFAAQGAGAIALLAFLEGWRQTPAPDWAGVLDELRTKRPF